MLRRSFTGILIARTPLYCAMVGWAILLGCSHFEDIGNTADGNDVTDDDTPARGVAAHELEIVHGRVAADVMNRRGFGDRVGRAHSQIVAWLDQFSERQDRYLTRLVVMTDFTLNGRTHRYYLTDMYAVGRPEEERAWDVATLLDAPYASQVEFTSRPDKCDINDFLQRRPWWPKPSTPGWVVVRSGTVSLDCK